MDEILNGSRLNALTMVTKSYLDSVSLQIQTYFSMLPGPEAIFTVTKTTNSDDGVVFPSEFKLDHGIYESVTKSPRFVLSGTTKGVVTSVQPISAIDPLPRADPTVDSFQVVDNCFWDESNGVYFLSYQVTNSSWITDTASPQLQRLLVVAESKAAWQISARPPKGVVLLGLVILVVSPLASARVRNLVVGMLGPMRPRFKL